MSVPTTFDEIKAILDKNSIQYTNDTHYGLIRIDSRTDVYTNPAGEKSLQMAIQLLEDGEYVRFFVFDAYRIPPDSANATVFKAFEIVSWRTKLMRFEYDLADGEVRPSVDIPIEDAPLTERQVLRCLGNLVKVLDDYHGFISAALATGKLEPLPPNNAAPPRPVTGTEDNGVDRKLSGTEDGVSALSSVGTEDRRRPETKGNQTQSPSRVRLKAMIAAMSPKQRRDMERHFKDMTRER